ncbi:putative HTH-type transcriptional regulator YdhC (plasmid) [Arthrobacter sp. StoSoilB3]|nr:putative HTH-type transcriptional regulator YdhC [Arthrobacter sp. StoSoilB3]
MLNAMYDVGREPLGEQAYRAIKQMIISGELAPGEEVPESVLAKRLGISRSPVRAALTRLRDDGLLVAEAWKVPRVAALDRKYVDNVYQLRKALDTLCAEQSIDNVPDSEIADFQELLKQLDPQVRAGRLEGVREANFKFHSLLITYADNALLKTTVARFQDHLLRVRNASSRDDDGWLLLEYEFLQKEAEALATRDSAGLVSVLRNHLEYFRERIVTTWPEGDRGAQRA